MKTLNIIQKEGYQIVQLNRGKANAINAQMVDEVRSVFSEIENDKKTRGVILTGMPNFFSAGLDVVELYDYDQEKMRDFFLAFGSLHYELSRFPKPFICAITGYSPAGGTVLAITADYRVMVDDPKFSIGLNEMKVNVQISRNLIEAYSYWLGTSLANRFILDGKLLTPQEAVAHNLVDEICGADEVLARAEKKMQQYLTADPDIFINTKAKLREAWHNSQSKDPQADLEQALEVWWKPEIREKIQLLIQSFKTKKS